MAFDAVLNDGAGVAIAARLQGRRFPENLNGSDFVLRILSLAAERTWSVFLYGGGPGVAEEAAATLVQRVPGLVICGTCHGYAMDRTAVARAVREAGANVVLVGLGNPLQEKWISEHASKAGVRLAVGVGAFLDFQAGTVRRAPAWMNRLGFEWCYRLAQEPGRLWRRYVLGNPRFLFRVVIDTLSGGSRVGRDAP